MRRKASFGPGEKGGGPNLDLSELMAYAFEQMDTMAGVLDLEGRVLFANRSALRTVGTTMEAVRGMAFSESPWRNQSEEARETSERLIERALRGESAVVEDSIVDRDGNELPVLFSISPILDRRGAVVGLIPEGKPVNDLKKLQARLECERSVTRQWLDSLVSYVIRCSPDGRVIFCNAPLLAALNMRLEQIVGTSFVDLRWPGNTGEGKAAIAEALATARQGRKCTIEVPYTLSNSRKHTVLLSVGPIVDGEGRVISLAAEAKNITEQMRMRELLIEKERQLSERLEKEIAAATKTLRETEQFSKELVDSVPIGIVYLDEEDRVRFANPEMKKKWLQAGVPCDRVKKKTLLELDICLADDSWAPATGSTPHWDGKGVWHGKMRLAASQGVTLFDATMAPLRSSSKRKGGTVVILNDVTKRSRLEAELFHTRMQSEKLTSLGLLVSGVAHEINNPLTSIVGCAEYLADQASLNEKTAEAAEIIAAEAKRSAKIVRNLLTFARQTVQQKSPANLNDLVRTVAGVRALGLRDQRIRVVLDLADGLPFVEVDVSQMHQVLLNLVNNAADAICDSGVGSSINIRTSFSNGCITLVVEDDGPGIPGQALAKIFDPFFTTKAPGQGTGLGLSICYGIIEEQGGTIEVENTEPHGVRVTVGLPAVPCMNEEPAEREANYSSWLPSRVLIVDDEKKICVTLSEYLTGLGCHVDVACDGPEALRRARGHSYDLLLVDFKMPGMDGLELYRTLEEEQPRLSDRFVFMTGAREKKLEEFLHVGDVPLLPKPFTRADLRDLFSELGKRYAAGPSAGADGV